MPLLLTTWAKMLQRVKQFPQERNDSVAHFLKPQSQKSYLYNYIALMIDMQYVQDHETKHE